METIELNRRFYVWDKQSAAEPAHWWPGFADHLLGWLDLHKRRRVVILAEAGSGKTVELKRQAELLEGEGKFAFYATLQEVARDGLAQSLDSAGRAQLQRWREGQAPAWFFIDSIDEAKLEKIRLESALSRIADGISGHENRAFIVLSGRHTEWEFDRDLQRLEQVLPIPEPEAPPPPELRTLIRRILNREERPAPPEPEAPLVVAMAPLDDAQMRRYSEARGVEDTNAFLSALRSANLFDLARRPLDLDWLARYWRANGYIGDFSDMVRESLRERLKETDTVRSRDDQLSEDKAMEGLQRAGAALVFARKRTFAIPDSGSPSRFADDSLDINAVLPDWPKIERVSLLNRAAFDPAAYGHARLHNDNEGVVSSYLTAQWLARLRATNLSARQLQALIFAQSYGVNLIRPSMRQTAAWLSIDDEDLAREVIRREPIVLISYGDPAGLRQSIRAETLIALTGRICAAEEMPVPDPSAVGRFAQPDIAPTLRRLWDAHASHIEVRAFLLKLVWLGALRDCVDIATCAVYGSFADERTQYLAAEALLAVGNPEHRRAYASHIREHLATVPDEVLVAAIEGLFPDFLTVDDLIAAFASGRLQDMSSGTSLKWSCEDLMERLANPADLERLIAGLMNLDVMKATAEDETLPGEKDDTPQFALYAAADRLLQISDSDAAPVAAIDAILFFSGRFSVLQSGYNEKLEDAIRRLRESRARRRSAFWRAAAVLAARGASKGMTVKSLPDMTLADWNPGLQSEDLDWLLEDGPARQTPTEQRLAANAAMSLWHAQNRPDALLARIKEAAASCQEMAEEVDTFLVPPSAAPELEESLRGHREAAARLEKRREDGENSWMGFVDSLRADPDPLSRLLAPAASEVSEQLFNLWQLLREASRGNTRIGVPSVAPLAELAGQKVADAFIEAARRVWRDRPPLLRSGREQEQRNDIGKLDGLCITSITIEAAADHLWANRLSAQDAARAAEYATLEINSLPPWIESLAKAWPKAVEGVLMKEVLSELNTPGEQIHRPTLDYIARGPAGIVRLMADPLWCWLESHAHIEARPLGTILSIVRKGSVPEMRPRAYQLAIERFSAAGEPATAACYLRLAAAIDAPGATQVLIAKLAVLNAVDQTALVLQVMPQLFDSRLMTLGGLGEIDVPTLQMLVAIAYRTVRVEDDNDRSTGEVYSPELRDKAQDARAIAFNLLVRTPGRASFDALHALKTMPEFSARAAHLEALARERAAQDSEVSVWVEDAAMLYERRWEKEPATGRELQMLAIQRIEDIQHDLLHADFAQGPTLSALPDEAAVQSWLADRMRLTQGWSYSVEREPETVAAKKPDIVLTARAANAKLPTEIKVAETWSLRELEVALEGQLCGQYLRARNCREGLLVLVHQKPRSMGWAAPDGTYLSFAQLVDRLKDQAQRIGQSSPSGPQPAIAVIDVTTCVRTAAVKSVRRKRSGKSPDAAGGAKQSRAATKRAARDTRTGSGRTAGAAARSDDSTQPGQPSPPGAARKP